MRVWSSGLNHSISPFFSFSFICWLFGKKSLSTEQHYPQVLLHLTTPHSTRPSSIYHHSPLSLNSLTQYHHHCSRTKSKHNLTLVAITLLYTVITHSSQSRSNTSIKHTHTHTYSPLSPKLRPTFIYFYTTPVKCNKYILALKVGVGRWGGVLKCWNKSWRLLLIIGTK